MSETVTPQSEPLLADEDGCSEQRLPSPSASRKEKRSQSLRPDGYHSCLGWARGGLAPTLIVLLLLLTFSLLNLLSNLLILFAPVRLHDRDINDPGHALDQSNLDLSHWPTDFTKDIIPKRKIHSHNDYWRPVPLYSALQAGCVSVEADIWLSSGELYVGHSIASLTPNRTLNSLYIDPLLEILSKQNPKTVILPDAERRPHGVFDTDPEQSLVLLIDFKTAGSVLFPHVVAALEPLRSRNYLTYRNGTQLIEGPITVVGTGNTPFELIKSDAHNPHHDVFFDAPLDQMYEDPNREVMLNSTSRPSEGRSEVSKDDSKGLSSGFKRLQGRINEEILNRDVDPEMYTSLNSYYASVAFTKALGRIDKDELSEDQLNILRGQIRGAHRRGLKARYWELPYWPIHLRNQMWLVLMREDVDMLNVDDLKAATEEDWISSRSSTFKP